MFGYSFYIFQYEFHYVYSLHYFLEFYFCMGVRAGVRAGVHARVCVVNTCERVCMYSNLYHTKSMTAGFLM